MKNLKKNIDAFSAFIQNKDHRIPWVLLMGEKGSGKTTLLYYLLSSNRDKVFPETAFNMIDISYGTEWFKLIDLGREILEDVRIVDYFLG
ncbi:MAG: ADP-ribosylation factor-like protein, partial [Candidatus Heimdallarchaeota archaeon]